MGIMILKSVSLILLIIFGVLSIYEGIKTYKNFNQVFKESKVNKVLKAEYYLKAKKMNLYYAITILTGFIYGILKKY
ncbi:hypothetical protein [Bacillus sp. AFS053548]|uniref:hypothetical protein n=1 Tax=Bacillus sp. AFS053548 TaxID=2033505 RepID=UPI000BFE5E93|nr:hypothetical protein [Bacillus sp. AFS053548]PGM50979.1 hypothetical protein CN946_20535 [Bacillus sp. AFS053548]